MWKLVTIRVDGMTCSNCTQSITNEVLKIEGIVSCNVSLLTHLAEIQIDSNKFDDSLQFLVRTIEDCGFDACVQETKELRETFDILVKGMTCSNCSNTVEDQLLQLTGIYDVNVSLMTELCHVSFNPTQINNDKIIETIVDCGFDAVSISQENNNGSKLTSIDLKIVNSPRNTNINKETFTVLPNVTILNFEESSMAINLQYDQNQIGIRNIISNFKQHLNLDVIVYSNDATQLEILSKSIEINFWKSNCHKACTIAIIIIILYIGMPLVTKDSIVKNQLFPYSQIPGIKGFYFRDLFGIILASYVQFVIGRKFYQNTFAALKHKSGTMDTLICISTSIAFFFSILSIFHNILIAHNDKFQIDKNISTSLPKVIFDTSTMLIAFISIGKYLENKAKSKTSTTLSNLLSLSKQDCSLVENYSTPNQSIKIIPNNLLQLNDIIDVKPGMKFPTDGYIIEGSTDVNESLMTGESNLLFKTKDDPIIGGTINETGHVLICTTNIGSNTKLSQIIETVKRAQLTKAPIETLADTISTIFVPVLLSLALFTLFFWLFASTIWIHKLKFFQNDRIYNCIRVATSVVVVACPCALGLATPTAIIVGTGIGAENGVLIKTAEVIERLGKNYNGDNKKLAFVFDKTGTLTTAEMEVQDFQLTNANIEIKYDVLLNIIYQVESRSNHPVAKSIVEYCEINKKENYPIIINDIETVNGQGIIADCKMSNEPYKVIIGVRKLLQTKNVNMDFETKDVQNDNEKFANGTISYICINDHVVGKFILSDSIKPDSFTIVNYLKRHRYPIYMITGDNHNAAMKVALSLDLNMQNICSEMLPNEKCEFIEALQIKEGKKVIFVGDGINDSPALVKSDLGIAISTGTEVAIEAADVVILSENNSLNRLIYAIDICQKTYERIKLNLFWAFFYNITMIPIAMGVLLPWGIALHPLLAGFSMAISSLSVVISSLRLKKWKPPLLHNDFVDDDITLSTDSSGFFKWFQRTRYDRINSDSTLEMHDV